MIVVSDSSPLITLARIGCFDLLPKLYGRAYVSDEVYTEVVIDGAGLPGAVQVLRADWIEVTAARDAAALAIAMAGTGLGAGELGAVALARELSADFVLIDEWRARRFAQGQGLADIGCIGILEDLFRTGAIERFAGRLSAAD